MTIRNVPTLTHPTIQSAIDVSVTDDTIIVAAGIYNEQISIPPTLNNLTLLGAQFDIDAKIRALGSKPFLESVITSSIYSNSGIVNISAQNFTINGFTIQNIGVPISGSSAIYPAAPGTDLSSNINNITGLKVLNNIIKNNDSGIVISSSEVTPKTSNYLIQNNYFTLNITASITAQNYNNFMIPITNLVVHQNLSINQKGHFILIQNVNNCTITSNNASNSGGIISLNSNNIVIRANVISDLINSIIFLLNSSMVDITNNIISMADIGINISGSVTVNIIGNCITDFKNTGILLKPFFLDTNSNININNNNIQRNATGLKLLANSYDTTIHPLNATNNYWNNPSGTNYNSVGLNAGDTIIDINNSTQSVIYFPFLTLPIICSTPSLIKMSEVTISKSTNSNNVQVGNPIFFNVSINVSEGIIAPKIISLSDTLPSLPSKNLYTIINSSPPGFFSLVGTNSQNLVFTSALPGILTASGYSVSLLANTTSLDAGTLLSSTATLFFLDFNNSIQSISSTAVASVA
jgi:hypothetical protein